ncbi:Poly(A) polymerase, nucleotidyltransferase, partial [Pseudoloma neurophilia]
TSIETSIETEKSAITQEHTLPLTNKKNIIEIKIDLLYSRLTMAHIDSSLDLSDSKLLKNVDEKSVLSLNGNRVADEILKLVPNVNLFHGVLRCIKYWSKRRQINGHLFGYPGGIAYAILVARICQLFPNYDEINLINKFFELYKDWKWPIPVQLNKIENMNYNFKIWDPTNNPSDRFHKMPIITPAYPAMCSTHNIFSSTLKRFKDECVRA